MWCHCYLGFLNIPDHLLHSCDTSCSGYRRWMTADSPGRCDRGLLIQGWSLKQTRLALVSNKTQFRIHVYHYGSLTWNYTDKKVVTDITYTGHSRYVDFAYLDTTTYVKVIFHSQHFVSIFPCISTPSMSKTVNTKQWVSRGDFSCPRRIFYYIC